MKIHQATIEDIKELAYLFDQYRQFYECSADVDAAFQFLTHRLTNHESTIFLARNSQGQAAGFVQLYQSFCSVDLCKRIILYDLYVLPDCRTQGVAEQLMNRATEFAIEVGAKRIDLETAKDNSIAQKLYQKLGYQRDNLFYTYNLEL